MGGLVFHNMPPTVRNLGNLNKYEWNMIKRNVSWEKVFMLFNIIMSK